MSITGFSLSIKSMALISDIIKLEGITTQFKSEERLAHAKLESLQKKRIDALIKPEATAPESVEIRSAQEKCLDARSAIVACQNKRKDLTQQIRSSLQEDKDACVIELMDGVKSLRKEEDRLRKGYLEAMAAAAVAQMLYLGWWSDMNIRGPGLASREKSDWDFFGAELNKLCRQAGIDAKSEPIATRIKNAQNQVAMLGAAISVEDAESKIAQGRTQLEPVGNH